MNISDDEKHKHLWVGAERPGGASRWGSEPLTIHTKDSGDQFSVTEEVTVQHWKGRKGKRSGSMKTQKHRYKFVYECVCVYICVCAYTHIRS